VAAITCVAAIAAVAIHAGAAGRSNATIATAAACATCSALAPVSTCDAGGDAVRPLSTDTTVATDTAIATVARDTRRNGAASAADAAGGTRYAEVPGRAGLAVKCHGA
jgi:hypothetical protein